MGSVFGYVGPEGLSDENLEDEMDFYEVGNQECIRCANRTSVNERKLCNECYELWG
ncbi:MAG: hypothetical protein RSA29_06325 [Clostridium sp.]|uniref:hypothetical protein n=1 Tax=Clostridium sp. TaxID=1506 RepID=UPI003035CB6A